ncbi:MAG TPA: TRAP transporter small permease [Reyranella sp.]|nr:TRAP transporter small permease [Reyranella sp.]
MSASPDARPFDLIERISLWLSAVCLIGMTGLMLLEVVLRGAFNSTTEHSDELVGYLLVGVSFLSLALCQSRGAFHRVEMVQMRLGARGQAVSALVFDSLSFAYVALTDWYFLQFVMSSYRREALAPTTLATPLWIPETAMIVGATLLLVVLGRAVVRDARELAA